MTSNLNENNIPATNLKVKAYQGMFKEPLKWQFENLITREELAQLLHLSPSYISKLVLTEGLPIIKIGRSVRFRLNEVESWLNRRRNP